MTIKQLQPLVEKAGFELNLTQQAMGEEPAYYMLDLPKTEDEHQTTSVVIFEGADGKLGLSIPLSMVSRMSVAYEGEPYVDEDAGIISFGPYSFHSKGI